MKIFYAVLIVTAGISLASACELPKEGTYDYTACWSGTVTRMPLNKGNGESIAQKLRLAENRDCEIQCTVFKQQCIEGCGGSTNINVCYQACYRQENTCKAGCR